jgi:hypothetical protein
MAKLISVLILVLISIPFAIAQLENYPNMFIEEDKFDGKIVFGANTGGADAMAVGDVWFSIASTIGEDPGADPKIINGYAIKFEQEENRFNLGENLGDEQKSRFNVGTLVHFADNDFKDDKPTIGIKFADGEQVFNHTMDFVEAAETEVEIPSLRLLDLEDASFCRLGLCFEILPASKNASPITELALMGGLVEDILEVGENKTYVLPTGKNYDVGVDFISGDDEKVVFIVNGERSDTIDLNNDDSFSDGIRIGVRKILSTGKDVINDKVRFYLGSAITVIDNSGVTINGEEIDELGGFGNVSTIGTSPLRIGINDLGLTWTTEDDVYIADEIEAVLPGLQTLKLMMNGFHEGKKEHSKFLPKGEDGFIIETPLINYDVKFDILFDSDGDGDWDVVGESDSERVLTETAGDFTYDEDTDKWFIISMIDGKVGESHILEITDIDNANGIDVSDFSGEELYLNKNTGDVLNFGQMKLSIVSINDDANSVLLRVTSSEAVNNTLITKEGLRISLPIGYGNGTIVDSEGSEDEPSSVSFKLKAEDDEENIGQGVYNISFNASFNSNNEATISNLDESIMSGDEIFEINDSDVYVGYVEEAVSTRVEYDKSEESNKLEIWYPGEETYGNVYWGTAGTKIIKTDIAPITDDIIDSYRDENLIVVGGPCANKAAADIMMAPFAAEGCAKGFNPGEGRIVFYDHGNGKKAVIIAGYNAIDTRKAAIAAANFEEYSLIGNEITIGGESFFDVKII